MGAELVGKRFRAEVERVAIDGSGVVSFENQKFFVKGAWPGDVAEFEITHSKNKYGHAKMIELGSPSPAREEVRCPHWGMELGKCGGCPWMGIKYAEQLRVKEEKLLFSLGRSSIVLTQTEIHPIVGSPEIWGYRNRAQLKTDGKVIGFVSEASRTIAPIEQCLVLSEKCNAIFQQIRKQLPRNDWAPGTGYVWNYIEIDEWLPGHEFKLNVRRPFRQGNSAQNEYMRTWISDRLKELPATTRILELFCGSGNFTEVCVSAGFSVVAVDVQGDAIESLREKKLNNVQVEERDLFVRGVWRHLKKSIPQEPTVLLLDPPIDGLKNRYGFFEAFPMLETVLMISCDIETFSSDVRYFIDHGWQLSKLGALDQFPHTPHLEILGVLKKRR